MSQVVHSSEDLQQIYRTRFAGKSAYRRKLWAVFSSFFSRWIPPDATVLDLGCGYCEFINSVQCRERFAMDLNPDAYTFADPAVAVLEQDCSDEWGIGKQSLDVVFTSNFFEHLPTKQSLEKTLQQAYKALKPGGRLIAMGPNIRYLAGAYWDFFDHYIPLSDLSLIEILTKTGFTSELVWPRFLPYTMSRKREYPLWVVKLYLSLPVVWKIAGRQFLVVASKPPVLQS